MRVVFVGASSTSVMTAQLLIAQGHAVVIVEHSRARIDELYEELDASFLHGDGSKPAILTEAGPKETDMLFCLTDNDQTNILASLVGRSLGFPHVVTAITDPEFEPICHELGLEQVIFPRRTISRYLADMVGGVNLLELTTYIRGEARFLSFTAGPDQGGRNVDELELPEGARVICVYRGDEFHLVRGGKDRLEEGDDVVILTHSRHLAELEERFSAAKGDAEAPMTDGGSR